jgi:hypothetical protein
MLCVMFGVMLRAARVMLGGAASRELRTFFSRASFVCVCVSPSGAASSMERKTVDASATLS